MLEESTSFLFFFFFKFFFCKYPLVMESPIINRLPHQSSLKRTVCNSKQYKKGHVKSANEFEDNRYRKCYHNYYGDFDEGHFGYQVFSR